MPDQKNFSNPDNMSIDALLEETKMQINAAPGESASLYPEEYAHSEDMLKTRSFEPVREAEVPQAPAQIDFEPDFGDAFADYGEYRQPVQQPMQQPMQRPYPQQPPYAQPQPPRQPPYAPPYPPQPQPMPPYPPQPPQQPMYDEPMEDELLEEEDEKPKKPKRKTGKRFVPLFVKVLLYVVIVGVISVGLGYGAWECVKDVLAFGRSDEKVSVVVKEGDSVEDIAKMLKQKGIIKYPWLFEAYCDFTDSGKKIEPNKEGESYELSYSYDYHALVAGMRNEVIRTEVRVTIPEGYTAAQIFAIMEQNGVCTAAQLEQCAATYEFDYWFLEGIPYGQANRLEGFLFPDTYDFYEEDDPERVLDKLLANFNKKFGEEAQVKLEELNQTLAERWRSAGCSEEYIEEHLFTVYELMTVASMIEKEAAAYDEAGNISSVIYNRLCDPTNFPYLNIDATVIYALGGSIEGSLSYEHLQVDSPYNTYVTIGLPAGPICNPGLSSISAALYPTDTDYFYYALDTATGYHHFSRTYAEHNAFLEGQNYD